MRNLLAVKAPSKKNKFKLWAILIGGLILFSLAVVSVISVNNWFEHHRFIFHAPVVLTFYTPIKIEIRVPEVIVKEQIVEYPGEIDTPIKKYICDKFGPYDCKIALAINCAEGNFRDEVFHVNDNGTIDFGCWQINQIHITDGEITAKAALDCFKATDWAYAKYKHDGNWEAWASHNNGSFKKCL
jgi:hypothetical protein